MPSFKNTAITVVLFMAVIGGITWFVQFMPNWRTSTAPTSTPAETTRHDILEFSRKDVLSGINRAVWEFDAKGKDTGYELENEPGEEGHYFFAFRNLAGADAELGFQQSACDCTSGDVGFLPADQWRAIDAELARTPWATPAFASEPAWHKVGRENTTPVKIPADGHGLLRVSWKGRKEPGASLRIQLRFWVKAPGYTEQIESFYVPAKTVPPLMFIPTNQSVGVLSSGETTVAEFHCWAPRRDQPAVTFGPREPDPLFRAEARPLSADECAALQAKLRENKILTRVRAAFLVRATLYEQQGDRLMDQGPFKRTVPIYLDEQLLEGLLPTITGTVRGDVEVGGSEDAGKIQLKTFPAAEDKTLVAPLYGNPKAVIELVSHSPEILKVTLQRNPKESTPLRGRWDLRVTVPANSWRGPMPDTAGVMLRVAGTSRLIRIPVLGTATTAGR